jgi:hypothetical protein
MTTILVKPAE